MAKPVHTADNLVSMFPSLYYKLSPNHKNSNNNAFVIAIIFLIVIGAIILINVYVYPIPLVQKVIPSKKNKNN